MSVQNEHVEDKLRGGLLEPGPSFYHSRTEECETTTVDGKEIPVVDDITPRFIGIFALAESSLHGVIDDQRAEKSIVLSRYLDNK